MSESILERGKNISFGYAALVVGLVFLFVLGGAIVFGAAIETMFVLAWLFTVPLVMKTGYTYKETQEFGWKVVMESLEANFIILIVGTMIAALIASGTVPLIIVLGLKVISPKAFLLTTLLVCSFTSLATGTSWGTIGTAGLAMVGIGNALGVPVGMTAGAVISGAAFGDKMSPLSDTTNLAAAVTGTPLMTHVKHMTLTTMPAYVICAIIFGFMGMKFDATAYDPTIVNNTIEALSGIFKFSVIELIPLAIVIVLLVRKAPPIIALLSGTFMGLLVAFFRQGESINALLGYLYDGYSIDSGLTYIDKLLNRGGIMSMISSFLIVFAAAAITGMLSESGILGALVKPMANNCEGSRFKTVLYTLIIGYTTNMIGSSMLLAEIVPGTIMKPIFKRNKLAPENLSRLLEDSGTLGAWLIPWNANAIFGATMLGASVAAFVPFCLLSWISPLFSLIYAATGITMKKLDDSEEKEIV
ncbi:transporter, NhaC family [Dethiosulfatibacter aminovorans DSM 17477]|uniref:Transporter, NhaC family n=1 Tax=Dethiosulfatibacter aminovorans DSM 17477 TaxID=1121476 RepID=A0A1M6HNT5_9FIRM|nr:Na+/H+ antiporter NhaC [Dethiosulfatibacter aminovorans]SHJ23830.1 transporter, NhaC family [Dethiosulfatibacter aminovorans DSM 17477]